MKRIIAIISILSLILPSIVIAETAKGKTIRLESYTGEIAVLSGTDKEVTVTEKMRVFNGYKVKTGVSSYVYLSLDNTKVIKLDQNTEILVKKSWFSNKVLVKSGAIFFNVTAPLKDNENLDLVTSTMSMGIRGTSGTLAIEDGISIGQLYTGKSRVTGRKKLLDVKAGEMVISENIGGFVNNLEIVKLNPDGSEIPSFGLEEINNDTDLKNDIQKQSLLNTDNFENQESLNKEKEEQRIKEEKEKQKILEQEAREKQLENKKSNTSNSSVTGKSSGGGGGSKPTLSWEQLSTWLMSEEGNGWDFMYVLTDYMKDYDTGMNTRVYTSYSQLQKEAFGEELENSLEWNIEENMYGDRGKAGLALACGNMETLVSNINAVLSEIVYVSGNYTINDDLDFSERVIFLNNATVTINPEKNLTVYSSVIYASGTTTINNFGNISGSMDIYLDEQTDINVDEIVGNYRFIQGAGSSCSGNMPNIYIDRRNISYTIIEGGRIKFNGYLGY